MTIWKLPIFGASLCNAAAHRDFHSSADAASVAGSTKAPQSSKDQSSMECFHSVEQSLRAVPVAAALEVYRFFKTFFRLPFARGLNSAEGPSPSAFLALAFSQSLAVADEKN